MGKGKSGRNNSKNDFKSIFKQNKGGGKQNTGNLNNPSFTQTHTMLIDIEAKPRPLKVVLNHWRKN